MSSRTERIRLATPPGPEAPTEAALPPSADRLWSIDDIGVYLDVSRRAVERLKSAGRLPRPTVVIGRMPRWEAQSIWDWARRGGR
jgi:hypothetical protein